MAENGTNGDDRDDVKRRLNSRIHFFEQAVEMLRVGAMTGRRALTATLRGALPLFEVYSAMRVDDVAIDDDRGKVNAVGLNPAQMKVVNAAVLKATTELIEITSVTHPVPGAKPYVAVNDRGQRQVPHLSHLISLWLAGQWFLGFRDNKFPGRDEEQPEEPAIAPDNRGVAYMAVAPGEFEETRGPIAPIDLRRSAMRMRTYYTPEPAIMANNNQPISQPLRMTSGAQSTMVPLSAATGPQMGVEPMQGGRAMASRVPGTSSCVSGGRCGPSNGLMRAGSMSPARYKADGTCESVWDISCETRWRIRECFKVAFCDMLRCLAEEICEDEKEAPAADTRETDCGEVFFCSLLRCLPDAICPPREIAVLP